jgi:hypothetical protein
MTLLQYGPDRTAARAVVRPFQPVSWAYMHLGRPGLDARHSQLRAIRERVSAGGANPASIEALSDRLQQAPVAPSTLAVFAASDGTIVHEQALAIADFDDVAGYSSPADVSALLAADQARPPFVCAEVDRVGADITYAPGGNGVEHQVSVVGPDDEIRPTASAGRAGLLQSRYENRAYDSWQHNARRVAERIDEYAARVDAQAVIICGEERVAGLVGDALHLPHDVLVEYLDGSRAAGHDRTVQARRIRGALDRVAERQTSQLLATFAEDLGTGRAVQGAGDTVSALAAGRVAILLVDPATAVGSVWFGTGGTELYSDDDQVLLAPGPVESGPLVSVAIRAALLSGAQVRMLPPGTAPTLLDGIGALCRFGAPT